MDGAQQPGQGQAAVSTPSTQPSPARKLPRDGGLSRRIFGLPTWSEALEGVLACRKQEWALRAASSACPARCVRLLQYLWLPSPVPRHSGGTCLDGLLGPLFSPFILVECNFQCSLGPGGHLPRGKRLHPPSRVKGERACTQDSGPRPFFQMS